MFAITVPLNIRTSRITRIEIKSVIKKLKNRKAAGGDNIPSEAIKAGGYIRGGSSEPLQQDME